MKIASWNVNSLKVRLPHLCTWLAEQSPDVLCLQETKLEDSNFPVAELLAVGYQVAFMGQKAYNGVALLSKLPIMEVQYGLPGFSGEQKRLIAGTIGTVRVVCVYVPNGQSIGSEKFEYKLAWLAAFEAWLMEELSKYSSLVVCGDFNIAPDDRDVHAPEAWREQILCSDIEREAFRSLLGLGLRDSFRLFDQDEKSFSWWDYRMLGFQKNHGLRIDHILISDPLVNRCSAAGIDRAPRKQQRPSDHAPVWALIEGLC